MIIIKRDRNLENGATFKVFGDPGLEIAQNDHNIEEKLNAVQLANPSGINILMPPGKFYTGSPIVAYKNGNTSWCLKGAGRGGGGTTIEQEANNVPIFCLGGLGASIEDLTAQFATQQTREQTDGVGIQSALWYQSWVERVRFQKCNAAVAIPQHPITIGEDTHNTNTYFSITFSDLDIIGFTNVAIDGRGYLQGPTGSIYKNLYITSVNSRGQNSTQAQHALRVFDMKSVSGNSFEQINVEWSYFEESLFRFTDCLTQTFKGELHIEGNSFNGNNKALIHNQRSKIVIDAISMNYNLIKADTCIVNNEGGSALTHIKSAREENNVIDSGKKLVRFYSTYTGSGETMFSYTNWKPNQATTDNITNNYGGSIGTVPDLRCRRCLDAPLSGTTAQRTAMNKLITSPYQKYFDTDLNKSVMMNGDCTRWITEQLNMQTAIIPTEINSVVVNPGKGWVLYNNVAEHSQAALNLSSVGYTRFNWSQIQPTNEATYDWSVIDNFIAQWAAVGKKVIFGVMNCVSSLDNEYITPQWVFTAGAAYTLKTYTDPARVQYIPVWDDPIYQAKCATFAAALAARYDGHASIAAIDSRPYGNYGERHVYEINDVSVAINSAEFREFTNMYSSVFHTTPLFFATGDPDHEADFIWEGQQGLGLRNDGWLGGQMDVSYLTTLDTPKMYELWAPYNTLKDVVEDPEMPWIGGWHTNELRQQVEEGNPSYLSFGQFFWSEELGSDADLLLADEPTLVAEMANRVGYHFVLKKLIMPETIKIGESFEVQFSWQNKGVARIFEPCHVALGLLNPSNVLVDISWTAANPSSWASDAITVETLTVNFENVSNVEIGDYKIVLGLFKDIADAQPTYKLGIDGLLGNGFYLLKTISDCFIL